jgi:hypothetical protein
MNRDPKWKRILKKEQESNKTRNPKRKMILKKEQASKKGTGIKINNRFL